MRDGEGLDAARAGWPAVSDHDDAVWTEGAAHWPELDLDRSLFAAYLQRLEGPPEYDATVRHAADLYLVCACLERVPKAIAAFEASYLCKVGAFIARIGHDDDFVQEATQALRERLLVARPPDAPRLASYAGRSSLVSWVAVCAQRVALDLRRRSAADVRSESHGGPIHGFDPETAYLKRRYSREFEAAISTALSQMAPRARVLLRLWLYEQLSMERIGAMYGVNVSTVSRWISKAQESLRVDIEGLVRARLGVTEIEFASLSRLIHSQLDETVLRNLQLCP